MSTEDTATFSRGYLRYVMGLFLVIYVINFVDRQIFAILIEPIKSEIHLSDTELGFLGGIAFALFYTFAGIPIARWADRGSRKTIISLAILIWSAMTMFTSTAKSFTMLLVARVGVGIGEAGCSPPIHSLISDYFPEERRGTALSIYALGIPIGGAIGTLAGGWIGEYFGWRIAFLVVGVPGMVIALVTWLTLREPPRGFSDRKVKEPAKEPVKEPVRESLAADSEQVPLSTTIGFLWRLKSFRHLSIAGSLHAFVGYGVALFIPSFFIRIHGYGLAETATYLFLIGMTGMIGTYLGGFLGDRYGSNDKRWYMGIPGIATLASVPFAVLFYTTENPLLAVVLAVPGAILGPMYLGPTFAMTQTLVTPSMRATASALLLFILNLIGLGLGPVFAGAMSDALSGRFGVESIRYSLLILAVIGNLWATLHYYLAAKTLRKDLTARDSLSGDAEAA